MAENKIQLTKADRKKVCFRHQFLQGSWNYERMQNGGWCFAMIPAIKKLYTSKDDQIAALKRHLEFYNTHPYVSAPVIGVTLALEEERANGAPIDDVAIQGVKVGMMGPLAGCTLHSMRRFSPDLKSAVPSVCVRFLPSAVVTVTISLTPFCGTRSA